MELILRRNAIVQQKNSQGKENPPLDHKNAHNFAHSLFLFCFEILKTKKQKTP